ncbi:MAG: hypothetical protein E7667_01530 [Ruminococcaceae bacterium]|nr:hypothetical protein [Oscillospiraceae bacterium]
MLKKIISLGAIYYTVTSAILLTIFEFSENTGLTMVPSKFLLLLLCSYIMSVGTALKFDSGFGKISGGICHAVCYMGGFFFCIVLPFVKPFTTRIVGLILFAICYVAVCSVKAAILRSRAATLATKKKNSHKTASAAQQDSKKKEKINKSANSTEYKSLFSSDSSDK